MDSFAILSNKEREVIDSGDEETFYLYILAHIFLGKMYLMHRRVGDYFFGKSIMEIRKSLLLDAVTTHIILGVLTEMGYAVAGTMKVNGGGREGYLCLTEKGRVGMTYWYLQGEDIAFEMVKEWHIKHGVNQGIRPRVAL